MDLMSARLGDQIMWSLLGAHGKGKYLGQIKPAGYRVHNEGVHSTKTIKQKIGMHIITYSALYAYYSRLANSQLSNYFLIKVLKYCFAYFGVKGLIAIAWGVARKKLTRLFGLAGKKNGPT